MFFVIGGGYVFLAGRILLKQLFALSDLVHRVLHKKVAANADGGGRILLLDELTKKLWIEG